MWCGQVEQRTGRRSENPPSSWSSSPWGRWPDVPGRGTTRAEPDRSADERVGTAEREQAAALVSRAYVDGLLAADELDEHLGRAYGAVTVADLDAATEVLPASWRAAVAREERAERTAAALLRARRGAIRAYVAVMVLLVVIWGVTALTAGAWYPWPIWPALGWGIPLLLSGRAVPGRTRALPGGRAT